MTDPLPTKFLPAEQSSPEEVRRQHALIVRLPHVREILDAMPSMVLMLNEHRQAVYANKTALDVLGVGLDTLLGKRGGEIFSCIHSGEGGCGTTEFCTTCGAANAIACALKGTLDVRECRIQAKPPHSDLDLKVWATPFRHESFSFTIFAAVDISHEKRRRILERVFFHDVLNTAGGMKGLSELLSAASAAEIPGLIDLLNLAAECLVEEILSQRDLTAVEMGEYYTAPSACPLPTLLQTIACLCATHDAAHGRKIVVAPGVCGETIVTDRVLLMRVVGNMIKNAAEAEPRGVEIVVGCEKTPDGLYAIWVRNPSVMPRSVQLQIFQRSFSTKGEGRGLGTYCIKLLTERFLKGKASFTSAEGCGTEFRVTLPQTIA